MTILLIILEFLLYITAVSIIFYIDWRYGIATILLVIADSLKTIRMMHNEEKIKNK